MFRGGFTLSGAVIADFYCKISVIKFGLGFIKNVFQKENSFQFLLLKGVFV